MYCTTNKCEHAAKYQTLHNCQQTLHNQSNAAATTRLCCDPLFSLFPVEARAGAKPQRGPRKDGFSPKGGLSGLSLPEVLNASGRRSGNVAGHEPDPRPHSGKVVERANIANVNNQRQWQHHVNTISGSRSTQSWHNKETLP